MLRLALSLLSTALAASALVPGTARASAFTDADFYGGGSAGASGFEPCTNVAEATPTFIVPLTANGAAVTGSKSVRGDLTRNSDFNDVIHYAATVSGAARHTTRDGRPSTLSLRGNGSLDITTELPTSACRLSAEAFVEVAFDLTLTEPMLVDARVRTSGTGGAATFTVGDAAPSGSQFTLGGRAGESSAAGRAFLAPGDYQGYLGLFSWYVGSTATRSTSAAASEATFLRPGERLTKVKGSGKKYVGLPSARTCPSGRTKAEVTGNAKRAAEIAKVELFVGDKLVKRVTNPKKGKAFKLKGPVDQDVSVRAVVTLDNGKVKTVRSSYVACTV